MVKGTASNIIAWMFIIFQIMLLIVLLLTTSTKIKIEFHRVSLEYLIFVNLFGIGALILSLIVWLQHKNLKGKTTTIASVILIIVSILLLTLLR